MRTQRELRRSSRSAISAYFGELRNLTPCHVRRSTHSHSITAPNPSFPSAHSNLTQLTLQGSRNEHAPKAVLRKGQSAGRGASMGQHPSTSTPFRYLWPHANDGTRPPYNNQTLKAASRARRELAGWSSPLDGRCWAVSARAESHCVQVRLVEL